MLLVVSNVPPYTLTPRFVINIRELYALDIVTRRGGDVDAWFGLSSRASCGVWSTTVGTIVFAEVRRTGGLNDDETIVAEERAESSGRLI